jgi:hypothetical protein
MPKTFKYVHNIFKGKKTNMEDICSLSKNENRFFINTPNESFVDDKNTRMIDEYLISVCLILYHPGTIDKTIYGCVVCYPPPTGVKKWEIKKRILEATVPIPLKDYDIIKAGTLCTIAGDDYTNVVHIILSGSVYIPVDNYGKQVPDRRYSFQKGWYKC